MKKNYKWLISIVIIGLVGVLFMRQLGKNTTSASESGPTKIAVQVTQPLAKSLDEKVTSLGELAPLATYNVMVTTGGTVETTYFEVGDSVKKGDVLFRMDTDSLNVQQSATRQQLDNAVTQAKLTLDQAQDNLDNQSALYAQGAVSKAALDSAQVQVDNAQIAYNNALTNQRSTSSQLSDQYDAYVQESPISGKIVTKSIEEGQTVSSQVAYTIIPEDAFTIKTSVASKSVNLIERNQKALVTVPSVDQTFEGVVTSISDVGTRGVYAVEISVSGDENLKSGMYAEIQIIYAQKENVLTLPSDAILIENGQSYVYVIDAGDVAVRKNVGLGVKSQGYYEILSGLTSEDQVVLTGADFLEEGDLVTIVE